MRVMKKRVDELLFEVGAAKPEEFIHHVLIRGLGGLCPGQVHHSYGAGELVG